MKRPIRKNYISADAYIEAMKTYIDFLEATARPAQVVKTINGQIDVWEAMERHCEAYQIKKGPFIFEAIKEKLQKDEK